LDPTLRVQLLGDFVLFHEGRLVGGVDTPRLQSLLAYLLLNRHVPQSRQHLAFLFWPDSTEAQALTNLRNLLYHLRRALPHADRYLSVDAHTLQWRADASFSLDVADLEDALSKVEAAEQAGDRRVLRATLESAVSLYGGDLLPACYEDWILPYRERLHQGYVASLERLVQLLESQRDYGAAIEYTQRLLHHDPLRESTHRRLMRLYALSGDRAAALQAYRTCVSILRHELDVEPSSITRQVYEHLLRPDASPPASARPKAGSGAILPLVGRDDEWAQLREAWQAAIAEGPRLFLLTGDVGIGKTRLAEELVGWVRRKGLEAATARCYPAEGQLAYAPILSWLRARPLPPLEDVWLMELARLLPELRTKRPDLAPPCPPGAAWQRQELFEALARAIIDTDQPKLLFIDDLQWCDRDTVEWLHYLLRFDPAARFLVVTTLPTGERVSGRPLALFLEALRRQDSLTEIELGPLNKTQTTSLAAHLSGRELDPALSISLYRGSEGNPLFLVEMMRAGLNGDGRWSAEHRLEMVGVSFPLPPKVRMILETRLKQLSSSARELAGLAATIGREFTFSTLVEASDSDPDALVCDLDELWQRQIIRQHGAGGYDFSHDKLRQVAYEGLSEARRRLLHGRVAQAFEIVHAADLDEVASEVAAHYERAGLPDRAAAYHRRAAEVAQRIRAAEQAVP
jgi:DNA-binding SARP family transcriptional activator